jgi:hypothetical protein
MKHFQDVKQISRRKAGFLRNVESQSAFYLPMFL